MTDSPSRLRPRRYATDRPANAATYTHPVGALVVDADEGDEPTRVALLHLDELDYYRVGMVVTPDAAETAWARELVQTYDPPLPLTEITVVEWHDPDGLHRAWVRTGEVIRYVIAEEA